jgi:hypothetical protein
MREVLEVFDKALDGLVALGCILIGLCPLQSLISSVWSLKIVGVLDHLALRGHCDTPSVTVETMDKLKL